MAYPPALFSYTVSPSTVPTGDSVGGDASDGVRAAPGTVDLQISVSNTTGRDVTCQQIGVTVVPGDQGGQLTTDVASMGRGVVPGTHWTPSTVGPGNVVWTPDTGHEVLRRGESVAFLLTGISVNDVPGLVAVPLYETTDQPRQTLLDVTKQRAPLGIEAFTAAPVQVDPGQQAVLSWRTTGASTCSLGDGSTVVPVPTSTSGAGYPVEPQATTTYTLTASGSSQTVQSTVVVTVPEVRVLDFAAEPRSVAQGGTTRLKWVTVGASAAVVDPGGHDLGTPDAGSLELPVTASTRFNLQASSPTRSDSQQVDVVVMPVAVHSFTADPPVVEAGDASTLTWATEWASGVDIGPDVGAVERSGHHPVSPARSTAYVLSAHGLEPQRVTAVVGVGAAITSFTLTADPGRPGEVQVGWACFVGASGTVTLAVAGVSSSVAPSGTRSVPLTDGSWVTVGLSVVVGGSTASLSCSVKGPVVTDGAALATVQLAAPPGLATEAATATVSWVTTRGTVSGRVANAQGDGFGLGTPTGSVPFALGRRAPGVPLWYGDLQLDGTPAVHWQVP